MIGEESFSALVYLTTPGNTKKEPPEVAGAQVRPEGGKGPARGGNDERNPSI